MQAIPLLHRSSLCPAIALLDEAGAPTAKLLRQERLPVLGYDEPDGFVPTGAVWSLLGSAAECLGYWDIGFRIAERVGLAKASRWGPQVAGAGSLRDAISVMRQCIRADLPNVEVGLEVEGEHAWFWRVHDPDRSDWPGYELGEQYILGLMLELVRLAEGPSWEPARVTVQASPAQWQGRRPEILGGARIEFGQPATAIQLPRSILSHRLRGQAAQPTRAAGELPAKDLRGSLQQVVKSLAREGDLSIQLGAELLLVSERTLRRRLAEEGTSWRAIVDRVRLDVALDLLADSARSLTDIAIELGYSQQAHFTRAFRRWTGESPRSFRQTLRAG